MNTKQKILAVDDEPKNLKIITLSLGDEWEIQTAASGEEALEKMQTFKPDLVLLDIMMPGIDGYEVCRKLRANPDLDLMKIVLVSGKAMIEERLKGYDCGADEYLTKPFVPEELLAKIKVFMRLAQVERQFKNLNESLEEQVKVRTKQLVDAEEKLVNSAKMSALGEMAGGIAHEINTPLATISLLSSQIHDLLQEEPLDKIELFRKTDKIDQIVTRIGQIILGLRTFARDGSQDRFERRPIKQIFEMTLSLCNEKFKNREIKIDIAEIPETFIVECRATQISQVILNLLNNAYDAISNLPDKWVKLSVEETATDIKILVTDSGSGISEEVRLKLFQPFFTTKEIGKGTGLGLSISKGFLDAHGGSLSIDGNNPHTCFIIQLPKKQVLGGVTS